MRGLMRGLLHDDILELLTELDGGFHDELGCFISAHHNGMVATISLDYGDGNEPEVYSVMATRLR